MAIAKAYLTLEEFLRLAEEEPPLEYEDGRITQKASPQGQHSILQGHLLKLIDGFGLPRRLAKAFTELRVRYAGRSLVPDVAVFRWDRIPRTPAGEMLDTVIIPPDIAIEITAPDQSASSLIAKCRRCVAHGVAIALIVDPDHRTVRRFRQGQPEQVLRGADRVDLDDVLPGFELTVDGVFAGLRVD